MSDKQYDQVIDLLKSIEKRLEAIELAFGRRYDSFLDDELDPLIPKAIEITLQHNKASASVFQRFLQIGYARAARILDQLADAGVISKGDGAKPRKIFVEEAHKYLKK